MPALAVGDPQRLDEHVGQPVAQREPALFVDIRRAELEVRVGDRAVAHQPAGDREVVGLERREVHGRPLRLLIGEHVEHRGRELVGEVTFRGVVERERGEAKIRHVPVIVPH